MSFPGLQAPLDLDTILTNNWTAANTDSVTPVITDNLTTPWAVLMQTLGDNEHLYIKFEIDIPKTGMYALEFYHNMLCTIEVITSSRETAGDGRAHFKKMMDETMRILKANARLSGYYLNVVEEGKARYDGKGHYIGTINIRMKKVMTS